MAKQQRTDVHFLLVGIMTINGRKTSRKKNLIFFLKSNYFHSHFSLIPVFLHFALSRNKVMHAQAGLKTGKRQLCQREFKVAFSLT